MKDFLFVFDLDFTLWDCGGTWCDHSCPPYKMEKGKILDSNSLEMKLYPDVIHILEELFHSGATLAIASRTHQSRWAEDLLKLHGITPYFTYMEMYPGSKIKHLTALTNKSGFPFERIIFYDDEPRNIKEVSTLGVNSILTPHGMDYDIYKASVKNVQGSVFV